jgi:DHA2 family multidrug resistance protein
MAIPRAKAPSGAGIAAAGTNPWLIAIIVSVATFMEVLDTTIANVALRYISGGLAVGPSQAAWVVTNYLVANSIVLCASSWLSKAFGRRNFFGSSCHRVGDFFGLDA